jgi:pyridoxamine 5'-phosphate oxidase family protein
VALDAFTDKEITYLQEQRIGRLATIDLDGHPHVGPVGFSLTTAYESIGIFGSKLRNSATWYYVSEEKRVSFVVDDLASVDPWLPRGILIRGRAKLHRSGGVARFGRRSGAAWIEILPHRITSWGIEGPQWSVAGRRRTRIVPDD